MYVAPFAQSSTIFIPSSALVFGKGIFAEHDVPAAGILDAMGFANFAGGRPDILDSPGSDQIFYFIFLGIGKLESVARENFDSVILIGIVGSGDHHARIRSHAARDEGDAGSAHRPTRRHIHSHRADARRQSRFQHVAADPRVFPDRDRVPLFRMLLADVGGGAADLERHLCRHRVNICDASYAIRTKHASHLYLLRVNIFVQSAGRIHDLLQPCRAGIARLGTQGTHCFAVAGGIRSSAPIPSKKRRGFERPLPPEAPLSAALPFQAIGPPMLAAESVFWAASLRRSHLLACFSE